METKHPSGCPFPSDPKLRSHDLAPRFGVQTHNATQDSPASEGSSDKGEHAPPERELRVPPGTHCAARRKDRVAPPHRMSCTAAARALLADDTPKKPQPTLTGRVPPHPEPCTRADDSSTRRPHHQIPTPRRWIQAKSVFPSLPEGVAGHSASPRPSIKYTQNPALRELRPLLGVQERRLTAWRKSKK